MHQLQIIGTPNESYTDRPTVKVIIRNNDTILLLNDGLLPGGGVEAHEEYTSALHREVQEELGASIDTINPIGTVIQYRDFLKQKYVIHGYTCNLVAFDSDANPKDDGEKKFKQHWLDIDTAVKILDDSIGLYEKKEIIDDSVQGKLFNLLTTRAFLDQAILSNPKLL